MTSPVLPVSILVKRFSFSEIARPSEGDNNSCLKSLDPEPWYLVCSIRPCFLSLDTSSIDADNYAREFFIHNVTMGPKMAPPRVSTSC